LFTPTELTVDEATIKITHNIRNYEVSEGSSQSYKGLEVFYHVYDTQERAQIVLDTLRSYQSTYADNPDSFMKVAKGSSFGFQRLRNTLSLSVPLIPVDDPQNEQSYYIDIKTNNYWVINDDASIPLTEGSQDISKIIRNISNRSAVGFHEKDFLVGDSDYTQSGSSSPSTVYIVCFAVSFGTDLNTLGAELYSDPAIGSRIISYTPILE
jgi:hypothetical protein